MTGSNSLVASLAAFARALLHGSREPHGLWPHLTRLARRVVPSHAEDRAWAIEECAGAAHLKLVEGFRAGRLDRLLELEEPALRAWLKTTIERCHIDLDPNRASRHALTQHVRAVLDGPLSDEDEPESLTDDAGRFCRARVRAAVGAALARDSWLEPEVTAVTSELMRHHRVGLRTYGAWGGANDDAEVHEAAVVESIGPSIEGDSETTILEAFDSQRCREAMSHRIGADGLKLLELRLDGNSNREIARRLARPLESVEVQMRESLTGAARLAAELGLSIE